MSIAGPLDRSLALPLYHQLEEILRVEIETGRWRPDERLPNETQIAERFGVSKVTVRQAMEDLSALGYIRRQQGRGTFVSRRKFDEGPRELTSFTEEMRRHGFEPSSRVLGHAVSEASPAVADALGVPPKTPVFVLKRLRLSGGEPVSVQIAHIPAELVPNLEVDDRMSLYEVLQNRYRLHAARARETYLAATATAETGKLLGIPAGSPVFQVSRVTFLPNRKPFEFVHSTVRGDRYSIVLDLTREDVKKQVLTLTEAAVAGVAEPVRGGSGRRRTHRRS